MQSRLLTIVLGTTLGLALIFIGIPHRGGPALSGTFQVSALAISAIFAGAVLRLRAATPGGAIFGGIMCALLTLWTGTPLAGAAAVPSVWVQVIHSALTPLGLLFLFTFFATGSGRAHKAARGLAENRHGRSSSQVLANLGAAAVCVSACGIVTSLLFWPNRSGSEALQLAGRVLSLAALAEATADTVSSEIGQAFGGQPRMLLSLRRAPVGSDGAVTPLGSAAGIAAAIVIVLAGQWSMNLGSGATIAAAAGGIFGLFFDSLLGATVERRGWFGNDLVNFSSTAAAALVAGLLYESCRF